MHPNTHVALRLLVLAMENHPADLTVLADYGNLPENLADVIDDFKISEEN